MDAKHGEVHLLPAKKAPLVSTLSASFKKLIPLTLAAVLLTAGADVTQGKTEPKLSEDTSARGSAAKDPHDRSTVQGLPTVPEAYRFVSHPDFLNQDVGDVTKSKFWRKGMPNGTNKTYEASLDFVLDDMVKQNPAALLAAGDLVEGAWGQDLTGSGVFGPTKTTAQRRQAVKEAAGVYFKQWAQRIKAKGLPIYPAVGDHEIGDNPWAPTGKGPGQDWLGFKKNHTWLWKQLLVRWVYGDVQGVKNTNLAEVGSVSHPPSGQAKDTAYATRLSPDLLLVTVDVFRPHPRDGIEVRLDGTQRSWLENVLKKAKKQQIPWVIVQGHTPVMGPVRTRFSSALKYKSKDLLNLMYKYDVDVYFSGEVHDTTFIKRGGLVQVSHGGLFYRGEATYIVGQVTKDQLLLETRYFNGKPKWGHGHLWSTEGGNGPSKVVYDKPSRVVGAYQLQRKAGKENRVAVSRGISAAEYKG